jgi:hypothetical protein
MWLYKYTQSSFKPKTVIILPLFIKMYLMGIKFRFKLYFYINTLNLDSSELTVLYIKMNLARALV